MTPRTSPFVRYVALVALFSVFLLGGRPVAAGEATRQIQSTVESALRILQDKRYVKEGRLEERREKLRALIFHRFDFQRMSMGAVGRKWRKFKPDQKTRFVELFKRILENSYMDKIENYSDEKFSFVKEVRQNNRYTRVDSIVKSKGQEYAISYRMVKANKKQWKVFDVIIEGIGLVANYRSQFTQILRTSSVEQLLVRLNKKVEETAEKNREKRAKAAHQGV